jgi:hypothetical protein
MALSPKLVGPAIGSITGLITSTSMSFVGLALNYGFQPDFAMRWLKAAATDVDGRRPADPALRHAAGRIADALRSARHTKENPDASRGRIVCDRSNNIRESRAAGSVSP